MVRVADLFFVEWNNYQTTTYPVRYRLRPDSGTMQRMILGFKPIHKLIMSKPRLRARYLQTYVSERILEYPFVSRRLRLPLGSKVLDFGCTESILSLELASVGYKVVGLDLNDYDLTHPNFSFVRGDIFDVNFDKESFDGAVAISTVEHVGLFAYGQRRADAEGDLKATAELKRILRPDGQLLLTVPFGPFQVTPFQRTYDSARLSELVKAFKVRDVELYARESDVSWQLVGNSLSGIDESRFSKGGVALLDCLRP